QVVDAPTLALVRARDLHEPERERRHLRRRDRAAVEARELLAIDPLAAPLGRRPLGELPEELLPSRQTALTHVGIAVAREREGDVVVGDAAPLLARKRREEARVEHADDIHLSVDFVKIRLAYGGPANEFAATESCPSGLLRPAARYVWPAEARQTNSPRRSPAPRASFGQPLDTSGLRRPGKRIRRDGVLPSGPPSASRLFSFSHPAAGWTPDGAHASVAGMPRLIEKPTVIAAAGNKPKQIEEFVGRVNSGHASVSVARMKSPQGWVEPGQRP